MQLFTDEQIAAIRTIVQEEMDKAKVRLMGGVTDAEYAECKKDWNRHNRYYNLKEEWNNADEQTKLSPKFDFIREYEAEEEKRQKERDEKSERERKEREEAFRKAAIEGANEGRKRALKKQLAKSQEAIND
jgi:hypothetical protein